MSNKKIKMKITCITCNKKFDTYVFTRRKCNKCLEKEASKAINNKIECKWCGNKKAPFVKLKDGGFICDRCNKILENESIKNNVVFPGKLTHEDIYPTDGHYETPESMNFIRNFNFKKENIKQTHPKHFFNATPIEKIKESIIKIKKERFDWWTCPDCGWYCSKIEGFEDSEDLYYIENGKAFTIKGGWFNKYAEKIRGLFEHVKKVRVYPVIKDYCSSLYSPYGCGHDWKEIHKCPNCNEEFNFNNGDY